MTRNVNLLIVTNQEKNARLCFRLNCFGSKNYEGEFGELYFDEVMKCKNRLEDDGYNVSIKFIDRIYEFTSDQASQLSSIKYEDFNINDPKFMVKDAHNIIIDFVDLLNENWIAYDMHTERKHLYDVYKDYKFALLACGLYNRDGFPSDAVIEIVKKGYETPREYWSAKGFSDAIRLRNIFKEQGLEKTMKPFMQGVFQVLGTLQFRGIEPNYSSEEPVRELLAIRNIIMREPSIKKFVDGEIGYDEIASYAKDKLVGYFEGKESNGLFIRYMLQTLNIPIQEPNIDRFVNVNQEFHYNNLSLSTRKHLNKYVYGDVIIL